MGELVSLFVLAALALAVVRLVMAPIRLAWKLAVNGFVGLVSLYLVNLASSVTGLYIPINAVTALIAGALGLPGIGILAAVQLWL